MIVEKASEVLSLIIIKIVISRLISPNSWLSCLENLLVDSFFFLNEGFIYLFRLCWVFVAVRGLSLVVVSGATLCCGAQPSHCWGFSCCGARAPGVRASVVVAHGLSCSDACGIFPHQGSNPCPLHRQADS